MAVDPSAKTFTPEPGQYLAYIHLDTRLHRRPPAKPTSSNIFASLQFTRWC
jgi:repressor LexA